MYKTAYSETVCKCWLPLSNLSDTNAYGLTDRLGPINHVLVALTARGIGAAVVTSNVLEFLRIAANVFPVIAAPPR